MRKFLIKNKEDWENRSNEIKGLNIDADALEPKDYPCIAIVAYAGEGWDEIDYCYLSDFNKETT